MALLELSGGSNQGTPVSAANPVPVISGASVDSTGTALPATFSSLASTFTYNADSTLATEARTDGTNTWTQTFTYTSGNLTGISRWVKS